MQSNYRLIIKQENTNKVIADINTLRIQAVAYVGGIIGPVGITQINLFNLAKKTQNLLLKNERDRYAELQKSKKYTTQQYNVSLYYVDGSREQLVYNGFIYYSITSLSGPDTITAISLFPIINVDTQLNETFAKGKSYIEALKFIVKTIDKKLTVEAKPLEGKVFAKSRTFSGNAITNIHDILRNKNLGFYFSHHGLVVYDKTPNEKDVIEVSVETGMIGIPKFDAYYMHIDMLINTNIKPGSLIKLTSDYDDENSGKYKVVYCTYTLDNFAEDWTMQVVALPV